MLIPALFAAFGCLCGLWLSIIGFAFTSIALVSIWGAVSYASGDANTLKLLLWSTLGMQVGYVAALGGTVVYNRTRSPRSQSQRLSEDRPTSDYPGRTDA